MPADFGKHFRHPCGWGLMGMAVILPCLMDHRPLLDSAHTSGALMLALVITVLLAFVFPSVGSFQDTHGLIHIAVTFVTSLFGCSHILGGEQQGAISAGLGSLQTGIQTGIAGIVGDGVAAFVASPFYLLLFAILTATMAWKTRTGLCIFLMTLAVYGLLPCRLEMLVMSMVWGAGYILIREEPFFLPQTVAAILPMTPGMRQLLLAVRTAPVNRACALFHLCGRPVGCDESLSASIHAQLSALAASGLVLFDRETDCLKRTKALEETCVPPHMGMVIEAVSICAGGVMVGMALLYFAIPIDAFPEALVGPIGYSDDIVVLLFASMPLGQRFGQTLTPWLRRNPKGRTS